MDDLSESELRALQHLATKKAGGDIPFINIAAARQLCDRGLAQRSGEGWDITAQGSAVLARRADPPS